MMSALPSALEIADAQIALWREGLQDRGIVYGDNPHMNFNVAKQEMAMGRYRVEAAMRDLIAKHMFGECLPHPTGDTP